MKREYSVYRAELRPLGYGLPIYEPNPSGYDRVRVGDVGRVTQAGYFQSVFNIFLAADHPINRRFGVPEGFVQEDTYFQQTTVLNELGAGSCIRSERIRSIDAEFDFSVCVVAAEC